MVNKLPAKKKYVAPYDPLSYWEKRARSWLKQEHVDEEWWPVLTPYITRRWKVLELGCGDGRWSEKFPIYTGCDISPTLLKGAKKRHPTKDFRHHDMRAGVPEGYDLIFTFTSWLHMPPEDIKKIVLPETNLLFIEPHGKSKVAHCFQHDYEHLFGCTRLATRGSLTLWGKLV